jgi:hypothetical protein
MAALRKEAAMGWKRVTIMSQRIEFVTLALKEGTAFSELCSRFGISRKTGYKGSKTAPGDPRTPLTLQRRGWSG